MTKVRQWWVPAEFRLPEPEFTKEQLDLLEDLIQMITPNLSRFESASRDGRAQLAHFLVDLGTGVWRVRRKMEALSRMPKEIHEALYSLESMWMSMSEGGVEIIDHVGTIPSPREARVVETKEVPGLTREQVVDALKPTILLRGEVVQIGEVIIGKPAVAPTSTQAVTPVFSARRDASAADMLSQIKKDEMPGTAMPVELYADDDVEGQPEPDETPEPERAEEPAIEPVMAGEEPRLDSETAVEIETLDANMEETDSDDAGEAEAAVAQPEIPIIDENGDYGAEGVEPELDHRTDPAAVDAESDKPETDEPERREPVVSGSDPTETEIEIPLPRRAPRRGRTVRDAVKQVISEEAGADAAAGTGRAKRRRAQASSAEKADKDKTEDVKPTVRKRNSARRKEEA
jgi:hypothetical protein